MKRARSSGYLLVEMLVIIGITGVLIGLLGATIHTVMQIHRRHSDYDAQTSALTRLDVQLRSDVHQAASASMATAADAEKNGHQLILEFPNQSRIKYHCKHSRVHRTVMKSGQSVHHDAFRMGPNARLQFEISGGQYGTQVVGLTIESYSGRDQTGLHQVYHIAAVLTSRPGF